MRPRPSLGEMLFGAGRFCINILDVGAIDNPDEPPPYQALVDGGHARIVGFEPDTQGCARLNEKYGPPHQFFPYFIGNGKPATFYETNWALTGSLYKPNRPLLEKFQHLHEVVTLVAEHPIETRRLDDIPDIGDIDFIKIDVQGAELAVFEGARRAVENAVLVQTEVEFVELYENQPLFADVDQYLRTQGYQFHTFNGFGTRAFKPLLVDGDPGKGVRQLLWSDAIYVKGWMYLERLSDEKLKKLAILVDEVVASPDLCHLLLTKIDRRSGTDFAARYLAALIGPTEPPPTPAWF